MSWMEQTDTLIQDHTDTDELIREVFVEVEHKRDRVLVQVYMPHVQKWFPKADTVRDLVYRWPGKFGPLAVGDLVVCPATKRHPKNFTGIVTSLDADSHPYRGPVRNLLGRAHD